MRDFDRRAREIGRDQRYVVTRPDMLSSGGSQDAILRRVRSGEWRAVQAGVYRIDGRPTEWKDQLMAALLGAGPKAVASHRAALILWGLDGLSRAPVELTVPHTHGPVTSGTVLHRSRRAPQRTILHGIPTTTIERTVLDCASILGELILTKAVESALRKRLTTMAVLESFLKEVGGRGVKGTRALRRVLRARSSETTTGSGSETEALYLIRRSDLPTPVLQRRFVAEDGTPIVPDFYWPYCNRAVEIDGLDAHDSAEKLDHDLKRQNKLLDLGVELRRFSARLVRREPQRFISELHRFLETEPSHSGRGNMR